MQISTSVGVVHVICFFLILSQSHYMGCITLPTAFTRRAPLYLITRQIRHRFLFVESLGAAGRAALGAMLPPHRALSSAGLGRVSLGGLRGRVIELLRPAQNWTSDQPVERELLFDQDRDAALHAFVGRS